MSFVPSFGGLINCSKRYFKFY